jgi:hypothetical protein
MHTEFWCKIKKKDGPLGNWLTDLQNYLYRRWLLKAEIYGKIIQGKPVSFLFIFQQKSNSVTAHYHPYILKLSVTFKCRTTNNITLI